MRAATLYFHQAHYAIFTVNTLDTVINTFQSAQQQQQMTPNMQQQQHAVPAQGQQILTSMLAQQYITQGGGYAIIYNIQKLNTQLFKIHVLILFFEYLYKLISIFFRHG